MASDIIVSYYISVRFFAKSASILSEIINKIISKVEEAISTNFRRSLIILKEDIVMNRKVLNGWV